MRSIIAVVCVLMMALLIGSSALGGPSVQQFGKDSKIDWTNHVYIAIGRGAIPGPREEPNRARAYLKAERYAEMAAMANLLVLINGTAIDFESNGKDFMADAEIKQRVEGFLRNVEITKHWKAKEEGDTIVFAEVRTPMFGDETPGSIFMEKLEKDEETAAETLDQPEVKIVLKPDVKAAKLAGGARPSLPGKPYTSLVIDTTGYKLDRCMSPKIRRADGSEVWGTVKVDYDYLQDHGVCVYATGLADAKKNARCGGNPLIISAIGRAGGKFHSDPVISDADAAVLLDENSKSGFLDKFSIIIIKDGQL